MNQVGVSTGDSGLVVSIPTGIVLIMAVGTTLGTMAVIMVDILIMVVIMVVIMAVIMAEELVVDMPIPAVIIMADKTIRVLVAQIVSDTVEPEAWLHQL